MIRLVTWDYNGNVVADSQACRDAGNHVIQTYHGTPRSRRQYMAEFSFPSTDFYLRQGCDRDVLKPEAADVFHEFYEKRAAQCRTRQGAREVLAWLKGKSVPSVILSNHMKGAIEAQLQRLHLAAYFEEVLANTAFGATVSGNNKVRRMGDHLARKGYDPADTFIVGDSPEDVGIGRTLGMRTVAIRDGYFDAARLRKSKPDHFIGNLRELIGIFEEALREK